MIIEDYCSYEVAKLLKEKGFDERCRSWYSYYGDSYDSHEEGCKMCNSDCIKNTFMAPTQAMAMKWLREVHGLFVSIGNDDLDYNWQIFDINDRTKDLDPTCLTESYAGYRKYEQACEAAIKYCLEHLI